MPRSGRGRPRSKPRRLIYAPKARDDLESIRLWLKQPGSGPVAWRKLAAIREEIRRLQEAPCIWSVGQHPGVRELPCAGGYRVFYDLITDTGSNDTAGDVRILRVFGPGQDRPSP